MLLPQRATGDEHQQRINTSKKIGELDSTRRSRNLLYSRTVAETTSM